MLHPAFASRARLHPAPLFFFVLFCHFFSQRTLNEVQRSRKEKTLSVLRGAVINSEILSGRKYIDMMRYIEIRKLG